MIEREIENRSNYELVCIETMVPKGHLLRKIQRAVDFRRIYDFVEDLYCPNNGRPSVDPVVLFKMVLLQHLYGISSLRRTAEEVSLNMAFRWFIGYSFTDKTPHFSTISYNFKHRFTEEVVEQVFCWILDEIAKAGYLSLESVFLDGTHIKANANIKKTIKKEVPVAAKIYKDELMKEINKDREAHGKKPFDDDDEGEGGNNGKSKEIQSSATDPESGMFHKGEHKRCFAYEAHTVCDKNGFVLHTEITPGNVHDSIAFDSVYDAVTERYPEVKNVVADSAYKTPWICKKILEDHRIPVMPYTRPQGYDLGHKWYEYVYDEHFDCIICPEYRTLAYATTNRDGNREYKSKPYLCEHCQTREQCTKSKTFQKTVTRHVWAEFIDATEEYRYVEKYKKIYERRKETIERCFADAKEKYGMRYTQYRGLTQVSKWVRLKFAAMNLKKLAIWKAKPPVFGQYTTFFIHVFQFLAKNNEEPAVSYA